MPKPTKICYIIPEYNKDVQGHFYHHYELLKELSKKLDIFLIAETGNKKEKAEIKNIHIQKFKFLPLRIIESLILILKARKRGYNIFYTHYSYIGAINAAIVSKLFKGTSYYWNCAMNWLFRQKTGKRIGYILSLKWSDYLVTGSKKMKEEYASHYKLKKEKIKILPNWINLERFEPSSKKEITNKILFIHWLSKRKGADMIIPIIIKLKDLIDDFQITVIGEGPYKNSLEQEIKEKNLEKYIKIIGGVPNKEISEYYDQNDILIMPSMEEGFPRVLLEAMAKQIPYVAFNVGAVNEISPGPARKLLVKPGDIDKFAYNIETILTNKELYKEFKKSEKEQVKKYDIKKVAEKFIRKIK
ncbi:MAG: glycosyltransferase [Candidatus Portnoybacteria bacterium]|nr:glycosyltransferase [Candidatus Portnoybacteria bacterium]